MRGRSLVALTALVVGWTAAFAQTDASRLDEAVLSADMIVVATIDAVAKKGVEWATSAGRPQNGESGHGELAVLETLWSRIPEKTGVRIDWTYIDGIDPPATRNPHSNGESAIYFLTCPSEKDGAPQRERCSADGAEMNEQFHLSLDERETLLTRLSQFPVRVTGNPSHRTVGSIPVTIVLENHGPTPLELPAVVYQAGRMVLGSGMTFTVRKGSRTGPEAMMRIGRIRTDASLAPLRLEVGGVESIDVDLQKLYGLMEPGYFVLEIGLKGQPPQRPYLFRLDR
jgi:hypothetical protein